MKVVQIFYIIPKFCQRFIQDRYFRLVRIFMHPVYGRYFFPEKLFSHNFIRRNHKVLYQLFSFPSFPYFYLFNKFIFIKYNLYFRQFKIYTSPTLLCISYYVGKFKHFSKHFMNGTVFFNEFFITFKYFIYICIGHSVFRFYNRFIEIISYHFSSGIKIYFHSKCKLVFMRIQ